MEESKKYSSTHKTTLKKNKKTLKRLVLVLLELSGKHKFHSNQTKTEHNLDETTHTLSCARCQSLTGGMFLLSPKPDAAIRQIKQSSRWSLATIDTKHELHCKSSHSSLTPIYLLPVWTEIPLLYILLLWFILTCGHFVLFTNLH